LKNFPARAVATRGEAIEGALEAPVFVPKRNTKRAAFAGTIFRFASDDESLGAARLGNVATET
jgi:hypothetical protein